MAGLNKLEEEGIACDVFHVETRADFLAALEQGRFDIILADYALPSFDGLSALAIAKEQCPDVPFIIVSGAIGEELAVEAIKSGATDYVFKQRLFRLGSSVRRALKEAEERTKRKRAEEALREAYGKLEMRVKERTAELASANERLQREITERKHMEEALRESEEKYRTVADFTYGWEYWLGPDGHLIYVSPACERITGYRPEEFMADTGLVVKIAHTADQAMVDKHFRESLNDCFSDLSHMDFRIITRSGEERWISHYCKPVYRKDGSWFGQRGSNRDITKRRKAEQKFKDLTETTTDWVWEVDAKGVYTYASPKIKDLLGYEAAELLGKTPFDLMPEEEAEKIRKIFNEKVFNKEQIYGLENVNRHKDGHLVVLETNGIPILDQKGKLIGYRGIDRDITERKKAEEALKKSEELYRTFINSTTDIVFVKDEQLRNIIVNKGFLESLGVDEEKVIGKTDFELLPEPVAERCKQTDVQALESGNVVISEEQTGEKVFETRKFRVKLGDNKFGVGGYIRDITERKRAEVELKKMTDELARSNADLKQFAFAASHDLQEPLNVIAGYVKLLACRYKGKLDTDANDFIDYIVDGVKRMQVLIKDLLAYSQVGTKGKDFKPANCSLVVGLAIANLQRAIEESGAVVTYDDFPTIMADFSQLSRLFQNLIGNAIKFRSEEIPKVHVSAELKGNEWVFSVQDNGIGMDTKNAERIFVIFQRLHTREEYPGTGMGLAICKKIVERHGGRIWVESKLGNGSTFYFTIPLSEGLPKPLG